MLIDQMAELKLRLLIVADMMKTPETFGRHAVVAGGRDIRGPVRT
jgi:hypothetical protein